MKILMRYRSDLQWLIQALSRGSGSAFVYVCVRVTHVNRFGDRRRQVWVLAAIITCMIAFRITLDLRERLEIRCLATFHLMLNDQTMALARRDSLALGTRCVIIFIARLISFSLPPLSTPPVCLSASLNSVPNTVKYCICSEWIIRIEWAVIHTVKPSLGGTSRKIFTENIEVLLSWMRKLIYSKNMMTIAYSNTQHISSEISSWY